MVILVYTATVKAIALVTNNSGIDSAVVIVIIIVIIIIIIIIIIITTLTTDLLDVSSLLEISTLYSS